MEGSAKGGGFAEFDLGDEVAVVLEIVEKVLKGVETRGVDVARHFESLAPLAYLGTGTVFELADDFGYNQIGLFYASLRGFIFLFGTHAIYSFSRLFKHA